MRKASKKAIQNSLSDFAQWKTAVDEKVIAFDNESKSRIAEDVAEIESRIESGECGFCLQSLIRHVNRQVKRIASGEIVPIPGDRSGWRVI